MELDPQASSEEIMSREVELGCESWTLFASSCYSTAVQRTLSLRLCPAQQLKQKLRSTLVAAQWRGHRLNTSHFLCLTAVHGLLGLWVGARSSPPSPPPPGPRP